MPKILKNTDLSTIRPYVPPIVRQTLVMRTMKKRTIEDLNDYCLSLVFSQLTLKQKFSIERVSKRWKDLIERLLQNQNSFYIGSNPILLHRYSQQNGSHRLRDQIDGKVWLELIANKCRQIKCISSRVDVNDTTIAWIASKFPTLECLYLKECQVNVSDGHRIAQLFANNLKHFSINCGRRLSPEVVANIVSGLPLLEELEINRLDGSLAIIFQQLGQNIKTISVDECDGFEAQAIEALRRVSPQMTTLRINRQQYDRWTEQQFSLLCDRFSNLKTFEFGFVPFQGINFGPISNLSQMENLKLSFMFREVTDWTRNIQNMPNLKRFHLSEGHLTRQVITTMLSIWSNLEDLLIDTPTAAFRCTCERRRHQWCEQCIPKVYVLLSRFQRLRRFSIAGDVSESRKYLIQEFRKFIKRMPALNMNAFPSLQWVRINWKSFPRAFKQPLYDGLRFVANRNPQKVIILETGVGLCRCHNPRLKEGWLSAIGRKRLSRIPPNLKFIFFRDV